MIHYRPTLRARLAWAAYWLASRTANRARTWRRNLTMP